MARDRLRSPPRGTRPVLCLSLARVGGYERSFGPWENCRGYIAGVGVYSWGSSAPMPYPPPTG
jgi:hypothetical protein